ncbi:hypothetical protein [Nostoc sp.]
MSAASQVFAIVSAIAALHWLRDRQPDPYSQQSQLPVNLELQAYCKCSNPKETAGDLF